MDRPPDVPTDVPGSVADSMGAGPGDAAPDRDESLVCVVCGATPPPAARTAARLTWSRGTDAGRTTWTCERCSRENLRSIESKLDPVWW